MKAAKPGTLDLTRINFSSISTYQRCPRQYYFRYILEKKEPPSIVLTEGSAHHAALEYNNLHKRKRGFDLKASVVTEKFMDELRIRVKEEDVRYEEESEDTLAERGGIWHKEYLTVLAPRIEPDIVEEKFEKEATLPSGRKIIISGIIDLGYREKVSDYKTTSPFGFNQKKRSIDSDLQLTFYAWASRRKSVENICFVKGNTPTVQPLVSARSEAQVSWALHIAEQFVNAVEKQAFPMCDPALWCCSEKYCGFWKHCRGKVEG